MGARPPHDHPHVYLDMGADSQILCPYCSTLYVHNAGLEPGQTDPDGCLVTPHEAASLNTADGHDCEAADPDRRRRHRGLGARPGAGET